MYEYLNDNANDARVVGSFNYDRNSDYKAGVKNLFESFQSTYQLDAISDITKILKVGTLKEAYKEELIGDVLESSSQLNDPYYAALPEKLNQLFENTATELLQESNLGALAPIVGITLPVLKKTYLEGHAKDIVMTEVPTKPIIKASFERRFLKDRAGNKHYIPDVFYNDKYKEIMSQGKGKAMPDVWYETPMQDFNILGQITRSDGVVASVATRDTLALDFCIKSVKMKVGDAEKELAVNVSPNLAANSSFTSKISTTDADGNAVEDILVGQVDFYHGTVSVTSTSQKITAVKFGGHISNENNYETIEVDRERELMEWKIPDGVRINTGLTLEQIKDYKALFDFDITTEIISDMSVVLSQYEDSEILSFLNDSFDEWKNRGDLPFGYDGYNDKFVEEGYFSCEPPANKFVTRSQWIDTELKFDLNRFIDELKIKLRNQDIMFVVYGHPNNITLIQDNVKWVIDEDTKIGGIQLDYKFGVLTNNKNRIHVISTLKCSKDRGLRVVAYPLTKELITFKHYKYSLNIENAYRNPITPLTPNVMGTSRFITTEVLPIQGEFHIVDNMFALKTPAAPTSKVSKPQVYRSEGSNDASILNLTVGATTYYTTDGTDPVVGTSATYSAPFDISTLDTDGDGSVTIKAISVKEGSFPSAVVTETFDIV